jgi:hypothetical protein
MNETRIREIAEKFAEFIYANASDWEIADLVQELDLNEDELKYFEWEV